MRKGCAFLSLATLLIFHPAAAITAVTFSGKVFAILDGDTIEVLHNTRAERIRLHGIDCPERGQAHGKKAKQAASELVFGKQVTLQTYGLDNKGAKLRAHKRTCSRGEEPMTHRCVRTAVLLGGLLLGGTVVAAPVTKSKPNLRGTEADVSNERTFEMDGKAEISRLCADKIRTQLPLTSVPTSSLALTDITVHVETGYYTVMLPLLNPQGDMRWLYWGADTIEEVTTFIRLMQTQKIKALKVEAYSEELRRDIAKPPCEEELRVCSRDTITNFLQPCKQCMIVEWVFDGRID